MRNSNKILLIAVAVLLAFVLAFILVMGLTARDLFEQHGRTVQLDLYRVEAPNTIDLSFSSTPLSGRCARASSSTAKASS
jgi:hypothetical protein